MSKITNDGLTSGLAKDALQQQWPSKG